MVYDWESTETGVKSTTYSDSKNFLVVALYWFIHISYRKEYPIASSVWIGLVSEQALPPFNILQEPLLIKPPVG